MLDMAQSKKPKSKPDAESRPRGRPASALEQRRQVRASSDDWRRWEVIASARGLKVTTWLRMLALDEERREQDRRIAAAASIK